MNPRSFRPAVAAVAFALAGCATGPDFQRPDAPRATQYKGDAPWNISRQDADDQPADAQSVRYGERVASDWWTLFRSPALDGLVRQAVAKNPTIAAADATLAQAR